MMGKLLGSLHLDIAGVEEVEVEIEMQKITVRGYGLEERKVVKAIKRAGKAAEAWPFPGYSSHYASFYKYPSYIVNHYYDTYSSTNNNHNHHNNKQQQLITAGGSPTSLHTFFQTPSLYSLTVSSDHAIASLFSDDNPHACSIM